MRFVGSIEIPASTPATAPAEISVKVTYGTLVQIVVQIPPGPAGLAGVRVLRYRHQIMPASPEVWIFGDGDVFEIPERLEIHEDPFELVIQGYNDDDTYPHTITVHVDVLPEDPSGAKAQMSVLEQLKQLFGL
jgi:hypothetical protein